MYRFGPFEFYPATGQLLSDGHGVELPPRAAFVLECLLERAGEIVSKDALLNSAWENTAVTEHSLIEAIKVLRRALDDPSPERRYVQTIHRRGYRFIAPVTVVTGPRSIIGEASMATASASMVVPSPSAKHPSESEPHPGPAATWGRTAVAAALLTVLVGATVMGWRSLRGRELGEASPDASPRFAVALHEDYPLWRGESIAISPDGRYLAYVGRGQEGVAVLVKETQRFDWEPLSRFEAEASFPVFSPDSRSLAYVATQGAGRPWAIRAARLDDGAVRTVAEAREPYALTWLDDGYIYFNVPDSPLMRVPAAGGTTRVVEFSPHEAADQAPPPWVYQSPQLLPGGESVLVNRYTPNRRGMQVALRSLGGDETQLLVERGGLPRYLESGHLLYKVGHSLLARTLDPRSGRVGERAVEIFGAQAYFTYAVSTTGTLLYYDAKEFESHLVWVDQQGNDSPVGGDAALHCRHPSLAPEGTRIAATCGDPSARHLRVLSPASGAFVRLVDGNVAWPVWTPDGARLVYSIAREDRWAIESVAANGSGDIRRLLESDSAVYPQSVSPDGQLLAYTRVDPSTGGDIWLLPLGADGAPEPLLQTPAWEGWARFSPDGRWIAFHMGEPPNVRAGMHVYVASIHDRQPIRVSSAAGGWPLWTPEGKQLLYSSGDLQAMMVTDVGLGSTFAQSQPRILFITGPRYYPGLARGGFEMAPDGRRLLAVDPPRVQNVRKLNVVLNVMEELKRLLPIE